VRLRIGLASVGPACPAWLPLSLLLACTPALSAPALCTPALRQEPQPQTQPQTPTPTQPPSQSQPQPDAAAETLTALMERYFNSLNQRDADGAIQLWSSNSEGRHFIQMSLPRMLEDSGPTWSNIRLSKVSINGDTARALLEFDLAYQPPPPEPGRPPRVPRPPSHVRDVVTFVREAGEWRINSEMSESQDIARRLLATADDAALNKLLADEAERIDFAVMQALFGLGGDANMRSNFPAGIRATSLALRLTEEKLATLAGTPREALAESYMVHGLTDLAFAYAYKPNPEFPKAIDLLTRALVIQERNKDEGGQGTTLQARGNAYYAAGDYSRALDDYQRALALQIKQDNVDGAARSRLGVGNVQFLFGQFDIALDAYQQALRTFEEIPNVEPQPRALQGMARVYAALGDYSRARGLYTRALTLLTAASRRAEQAGTLLDIGHTCFLQGKLDDAATNINQALAINTELKDAAGQGRALFALGLLQVVRAKYDEAIQTYTRSAEAFTRANFPDGLGQAILARAAAKFERHDLPGALADYTDSARTFEAVKNREGVARANVGLAMAYVLRKEIAPALESAETAWKTAEQAGAPEIAWQARYEWGRALALAGDADRARQQFEESVTTLERSQFEAGGEADSASPARRAAPYVALVEWYVAHGDATRALLLADGAKRRLLQDLMLPYRFRVTRGLTPEQQREERRLFSERVSIAKQIRRERQRPLPDASRIAQLDTQIAAARTAAAEWDRTLARDHFEIAFQRGDADFNSATQLEQVAPQLEQLAQKLNDVSALVHFVVGEERTTVLVATRKHGEGSSAEARAEVDVDVRAYTVQTPRVDLATQVLAFADAIERRRDTIAAEGRALYDRLLGPAREQLADRTQLVIVPDDSLWMLPFDALRAPGDSAAPADRYLAEQGVTVTLMPSVAAWVLQPPYTPAPGTPTQPLMAIATISDVTPMQSSVTLPPPPPPAPASSPSSPSSASSQSSTPASPTASPTEAAPASPPAPATLAAWELFDHPLHAESMVLIDRTPAEEQIRLDQGRLGAMGLAWALQIAGIPRVTIARWPLDPDEHDRAKARALRNQSQVSISNDAPPVQPHEWAAWMTIGPPPQPPPPPPQSPSKPPPAPPQP
jgi:tetratricopeptide (TPR) repeat protein